jgi:endonuclease YncB( thermonuclease family)
MFRRLLLFVAALAFALSSQAQVLGHVVKVHDGDTLTVLVDGSELRVRLDGIDAPELAQPYGRRSRDSLSELCGAKQALVTRRGKDRYGRTIGRVSCAGIDAGDEQVRRGMAWVYVRYARADSPMYGSEHDARLARRGLWADLAPVAPWAWRQASR